jgi:hypothetical protein
MVHAFLWSRSEISVVTAARSLEFSGVWNLSHSSYIEVSTFYVSFSTNETPKQALMEVNDKVEYEEAHNGFTIRKNADPCQSEDDIGHEFRLVRDAIDKGWFEGFRNIKIM